MDIKIDSRAVLCIDGDPTTHQLRSDRLLWCADIDLNSGTVEISLPQLSITTSFAIDDGDIGLDAALCRLVAKALEYNEDGVSRVHRGLYRQAWAERSHSPASCGT